MRFCGFSELFHDAGLAFVTEDGHIEYASHAERYSKIKNDPKLPPAMVQMIKPDDHVTFYEDHKLRMELGGSFTKKLLRSGTSIKYNNFISHHQAHAASGYFTRPWDSEEDTVILTVDGVGEWQTMGIYNHKLELLEQWPHPVSLGLLYTQVTKLSGLRTLEDEYVTMGMSAYGEPVVGEAMYQFFYDMKADYDSGQIIPRTRYRKLWKHWFEKHGQYDMSASVQYLAERLFADLAQTCRKYGSKLVVSGGSAQNIIAMSQIKQSGLFEDMWVAVAPSDAGSALGAAAYSYWKATGNSRVTWNDAYLGHDMGCTINPSEVVDHLLSKEYCGIASGRAEFGPRALGNRSLIADVRKDVKNTVNSIKQRQKYRPFAPSILEEHAEDYFEGPMNKYMQYTSKALHDYKSVTHVDGTARVQIVPKDCTSVFRKIIEEYYDRTGVPMLLNTSLNIRGMPIVNDKIDARRFETKYGVKVFT